VSFLDVGQGDATLIQRGGRAILFDTGPPGGPIVARLREAGVRRLDALVITHAQADHEGMAVPVLDRFHPRLVVDGGAGWPTAVQRALPRAASAGGARVVTAAAGDRLRLGALRIAFLSPTAEAQRAPPTGDPNTRALVAHLRSGAFDLLLTADAESDVTGGLDLPRVEALKVAHHGSDDPGLEAELEQLEPAVAAIEVGRRNTYGHPTAATLATLRTVPRVYRTDRDGTVQLHVTAERMWVTKLHH
jgi:competence protein ComEC